MPSACLKCIESAVIDCAYSEANRLLRMVSGASAGLYFFVGAMVFVAPTGVIL